MKNSKSLANLTTETFTVNNDRRYDNDYHSKEKAAQIHRINREFDAKVTAVRNNRRMRAFQKSRQIRMLEKERMEQIRKVNARYSKSNDRYDNDFSKADKKKW